MLSTIRRISGHNLRYLKRPAAYAVLEGITLASFHSLAAFIFYNTLREGSPTAAIWGMYAVLLAVFGLRVMMIRRSYGGGMAAGYEAGAAIRMHLGEHLRRLPMGFFNEHDTGELANRLFYNVGMVEMMIGHFFTQAITNMTLPMALALLMLFWSPLMTVVMLAALLPGIPLLWFLLRLVDREGAKRVRMIDASNAAILEYLHGIAVFRAFNMTGTGFRRLDKILRDFRDFSIRFEIKGFAVVLTYTAILESGFMVLLLAGTMLVRGERLTAAAMPVFLLLSLRFYRPLHRFSENAALTRVTFSGAKAIEEVLATKEIPGHEIPESGDFTIRLENVSFGYKGKTVIHDVDLTIPERGMTALVGPSGSGKSTLARLVARFWDVDRGCVKLGGKDIRTMNPEALLGRMSIVFQDVYLFRDTVLNNLRIGNMQASQEDIVAAARAAQCHEFIQALPDGYNTFIGEGGATLSGGEKQRIAIARAMLKNAPIILLDEATAALDPENDRLIQAAIDQLIRSRTVLVIAHRLHTIMNAGQIVVLEQGRIVQRGTHQELLLQGGWYAEMWREQQARKEFSPGHGDARNP